MNKLFITIILGVLLVFVSSGVVLADPGDEHRNGYDGAPRHGDPCADDFLGDPEDCEQPQICSDPENPECDNWDYQG